MYKINGSLNINYHCIFYCCKQVTVGSFRKEEKKYMGYGRCNILWGRLWDCHVYVSEWLVCYLEKKIFSCSTKCKESTTRRRCVRDASARLRWGWAAGQSHCSTIQSSCFYTHIQLFQIFTPWGQCWNCVHLSSLHTQLELTLAFIFAAGQWVSLTETFRPLRWLLSSSVSLSLSLPLFVCACPHWLCFLFICLLISIFSFSSFIPFIIPFTLQSPILSLCSFSLPLSLPLPLSGPRQIVL